MILKRLVSNRCSTANQLTIRQAALRRHPTRTSKTNNYVRCCPHHWNYRNEKKMKDKHELITLNDKAWWSILLGILKYQGNLMQSVYRSEKQMHNEYKVITQNENAWWQVLLEIWKFQGNLMQCCHATVNWVKTRFPKETEVMILETDSWAVFILFLDLLTRPMLGNLFLMGTKIICLIRQGLKLWSRNIKWNLLTICIDERQQQAYAQRLELEDAHHRFFRNSKRTISPTRKLSMKDKALRETQIRNMHEMGEMERGTMRQHKGSLHKCRRCKSRWILWMT